MFNRVRGLHSDRNGNEAMQTVMIMAVGVLLLTGLFGFVSGDDVWGKIKTSVTSLLKTSVSTK